MGLDVLVVSPCSGTKQFDAVVSPSEVDKGERTALVDAYPGSVASAVELYEGREHNLVQSAVARLGRVADVEWRIVSAGFGVVSPETTVPAYDCTFSEIEQVRERGARMGLDIEGLTNDELVAAVGREKRIPQDLRAILGEGFDVVFVVLGKQYLIAAEEALTPTPKETTTFAFASKGSKEFIGDCQWVPATDVERSQLGTTWLELRGRQLLTFAENIEGAQHLGRACSDPEAVRELSVSV